MAKATFLVACAIVSVVLFHQIGNLGVDARASRNLATQGGNEWTLASGCNLSLDGPFSRRSFPKNFTFGFATAAYQVEGAAAEDGRGPSIWDVYSHTPGKTKNGDTGDVADDEYHKFREDVQRLKTLGADSYRFSISWSRVIPQGVGDVNPLGIAYYNNLINSLLKAGIKPAVTLYHWDLPQYVHEHYGGWLNASSADWFAAYADVCFKSFGDRVQTWITFNEPMETANQGYALGSMAPGRCSDRSYCPEGNTSTEAYIVAHNILRSHGKAVAIYRANYQKQQCGRIGITLDTQYNYPVTDSPADIAAAERGIIFAFGWFADPIWTGDYPAIMREYVNVRLPNFSAEDSALIRGSADFFGLNYYTASWASEGQAPAPGTGYSWSDNRVATAQVNTSNGVAIGEPRKNFDQNTVCAFLEWASQTVSSWLYVVPKSIHDIVIYLSQRYRNFPLFITENGVSDSGDTSVPLATSLCDAQRVNFYKNYLTWLARAIKEGANVQGYFAWSLLDNFEWSQGFTQRFGIIYVNFTDPARPRYPKASALWWKKFLHPRKH
eukprot:jgi/Mesen1/8568/ME000497S07982